MATGKLNYSVQIGIYHGPPTGRDAVAKRLLDRLSGGGHKPKWFASIDFCTQGGSSAIRVLVDSGVGTLNDAVSLVLYALAADII